MRRPARGPGACRRAHGVGCGARDWDGNVEERRGATAGATTDVQEAATVAEIEIGIYKSGRRAYGFDDIAIVPSRRTRDPEDVDISWEIDAFRFDLPLMAAAMDGVVSPRTAIEIGRLGGLAVLNLEGLWTRYEDPEPLFEEIAKLDDDKATARMQQMYLEPIKPELVTERIREIKAAGVVSCASVTPQRTTGLAPAILAGELDMLVIQGTVVSAEHVSKTVEPLNLKKFIRALRPARHRGRLRLVPGRPAPHAHRRGGRARRGGPGQRLHHPGRARPRRAPGHRHRRRGRGPHAPPRRDRRLRARHRRRRHEPRRRHRQGHRLRCRRRHARLAACRRPRRPRVAAFTGAWPRSTPRCRAGRGCGPRCGARCRRSSSGPPTRTTGA